MPRKSITHEEPWEKVIVTLGCWHWIGAKTSSGYGHFYFRPKHYHAHRWFYELLVGPIPEGHDLDHLCENRYCVNPAHLNPVSKLEHRRRHAAFQTHCKHGHPLSGDNLLRVASGQRVCRECNNRKNRAREDKTRTRPWRPRRRPTELEVEIRRQQRRDQRREAA